MEIPEEYVLAFVRILQEAVSNSARHGGATNVSVALQAKDSIDKGTLFFQIKDNGKGFAAQADTDYERLRTTGHRGLAHIHERVQLLKGTINLKSEPGNGCLLEVDIPIQLKSH